MGLFDAFKASNPIDFDEQEAIMTIVISAIMADGQADDEEVGRLRSMCARSPVFASNPVERDDRIINFAVRAISQLGRDAVVKAAAALRPPLREVAFAFAVEVVMADGVVGTEEEKFITDLATALGIGNRVAEAVVLTTTIRCRSL